MVNRSSFVCSILSIVILSTPVLGQEQPGGIRGMVYDKDYDVPLGGAAISIVEIGARTASSEEGNFVFPQVPPGTYTLIFSKDGFTRKVIGDITVQSGQMMDVEAQLAGEITEMEEFSVEDFEMDSKDDFNLDDLPLLELRQESPAFIDAISSDIMSKAGATDAASALKLVAGASVQDGKYAVVRGLPDRYVNSQMNGVRLPTADPDKRAVQLDQFPASAIKSILVTKTFTPDQQGDASGGAVNIVLKGIPEEDLLEFSFQKSSNTNVDGNMDFLTYKGGGVNYWGKEKKEIQYSNLGSDWDGAVGVSTDDPPEDYKWSLSLGKVYKADQDIKLGGYSSLFYERDSSFYDNGINDKYWVESPGAKMTPQYTQGTPGQGDFKTQLYDVTRGGEEVKWGALNALGLELEKHSLTLTHLYTHTAEDLATLAEDERGKAHYFPGYDPNDPHDPGNLERDSAPYLRTETLEYTERTTETLQLHGQHELPDPCYSGSFIRMLAPKLDWTLSKSSSSLYQPDKRQFGSLWWAESYNPGYPPYIPSSIDPAVFRPYKPAANYTLGNFQRVWKDISEESDQYSLNVKLPFEQWTNDEGYLKVGVFDDSVNREYKQDSFSNFNDNSAAYYGSFDEFWSEYFPYENHPVSAAEIDVDYEGEQKISAYYYMMDLPITSTFNLIGGVRLEKTELGIKNSPESEVTWIPPRSSGQVTLNPGDADVSFQREDVLPSVGFVYKPLEKFSFRGTYSETVARQTFKELTPIQQQDYLGSDVFVGNPDLEMSSLKNYDLRFDYTPYAGGLYSVSYFKKDIKNPIEYEQRIADFAYTTPVNYPEGTLSGYELEIRQIMEKTNPRLQGLTLGANATFIKSEVTLPEDEASLFEQPNINAPMPSRDMTNTPEYLYNLFMDYELGNFGLPNTQLSVFYTVKGDTLIVGAGQSDGNFIPNVYAKEYGTLNMSVSHKFSEKWNVKVQAKNLLDPKIQTVYRSKYIGKDVIKTSYQEGMEFSFTMNATF